MTIAKIKVLFLASNPIGASPLNLDRELRLITKKIRSAEYREAIDLIPCLATQADDLIDYLNQYRPDIVHFSGHGSPSGEILLVGKDGSPMPVSPQALKQLLEASRDKIRVVLLNACYTSGPSQAIHEVIDYAVGMNTGISDDAAASFAAQFYSSLAYGLDVPSAFDQAVANLAITNPAEVSFPELKIRPGAALFPTSAASAPTANPPEAPPQTSENEAALTQIPLGETSPEGDENRPSPSVTRRPRWVYPALAALAVLLFAGGWLAARQLNPPAPLLGVALTSLRYQAGGWDPRQVDLRTSGSDGLRVNTDYSLLLTDLWVAVPDDLHGYLGQLEVYARGEVIGQSDLLELIPGGTRFPSIHPTTFQHDRVEDAWSMQADWDNLDIALIVYAGSPKKPAGGAVTHLALNKTGKAWYLAPPYAHLVALVYSVNAGTRLKLDFSSVLENGLDVSAGDQLTIYEIWYKTEDTDTDHNLQVEVYPSAGDYDGTSNEVSVPVTFKEGIHNLLQEPFTWDDLPADRELLIVTLSRTDHTVLDRYVILLGAAQSPGLVPLEEGK